MDMTTTTTAPLRKSATAMVTSNLVKTTIYWPNGNITQKTIDFCNSKQVMRFAKLAFRCYAENGEIVCLGVNEKPLDPAGTKSSVGG